MKKNFSAFFVSRTELLDWINSLLALNYTKVEQVSTGAALCQVFHNIYPGSVRMSRVKFNARTEPESIHNFKILQDAFAKMEVDKHIDVDRLVKGKYQDNLEFLQWMKRFHDMHNNGQPYDPIAHRKEATASDTKAKAASSAPANAASPAPQAKKEKPEPAAAAAGAAATTTTAATAAVVKEKKGAATAEPTKENLPPKKGLSSGPAKRPAAGTAASAGTAATAAGAGATTGSSAPVAAAQAQIAAAQAEEKIRSLTETVAELTLAKAGLEKERDFYFGKLRDMEILCQTRPEAEQQEPLLKQIFAILYATEEDFVQV
jgi:RP/EB family microtubule-associated protein